MNILSSMAGFQAVCGFSLGAGGFDVGFDLKKWRKAFQKRFMERKQCDTRVPGSRTSLNLTKNWHWKVAGPDRVLE